MSRYLPPALAALAGAALVAALLAVAGWPGPTSWQATHVLVGGALGGAWTWTQQRGVMPAGVLVEWWPPVMGAALVVAPVLAHLGGMLAIAGSAISAAVAAVSVWVARDCVDRLDGVRRQRTAPPPERHERIERLDRVHSEITEQIRLLDHIEARRSRQEAQTHA